MIQNILSALDTRVDVSVESPDPEQFVNGCVFAGIRLCAIRRLDALTLACRMHAADFRRLPAVVRGKHCRVRIRRKSGFAEYLKRCLRRPFFWAGAAFAVAALAFSSRFIWNVSILHAGGLDREILRCLASFGLQPGVSIDSIDEDLIQQQVIAALPELSWIGIYLRGSTAEIDYRLRTPAPEVIPLDAPYSVYAAKTGIITKLYAYQGKPAAAVGETVLRGDLIVSAVVPIGEDGRFQLVHALADVEARTWYDLQASAPLTASRKIYTGKKVVKKYVVFPGRRTKFPFDSGKLFDAYDIIIERKQLTSVFPLTIVTEQYLEYITEPVALDPASEQARLTEALTASLRSSLVRGEILSADVSASVSGDVLTVRITGECREDIALPQPYSPVSDSGSSGRP